MICSMSLVFFLFLSETVIERRTTQGHTSYVVVETTEQFSLVRILDTTKSGIGDRCTPINLHLITLTVF